MRKAAGEGHSGHVKRGHLRGEHALGFVLRLNGSDQSNHLVQGAFVWLLARRAGVDQLIDQAVEEINIHSTEGRRGPLAKRVASLERAPASPDDA